MDWRRIDGFAIDLDGVVWLAGVPIDGSVEAIARLRSSGRSLVFVTNDPRSTRAEFAARLARIGVEAEDGDVLTSATATAEAVAAASPGARVLAVGTPALADELRAHGLVPLEPGRAGSVDAVVVGGHPNFDYEELRAASSAVRAGAALWATNRDPTYPTDRGLAPGTGALVAAIETAAESRARSVGKPEPAMFEAAAGRLAASRPAMVGDSLDSDVAGAARAGFATALVLTGRSRREDLAGAAVAPDLVADDLAGFAAAVEPTSAAS